ncbi:hypothetical protein [Sphingomonas sp. M1-B02]|uniref:hypothetical protein n=1 Tax=Sphingomonas sp. M1-B02 TaxID=3114300 RepID=UPI0022409087|nr:hypothetical protein [Sphingomonas sp. S6-11]UZK67104.1 hypothetical protein OKW87_04545 [Sphingomonas sp. S6-11]
MSSGIGYAGVAAGPMFLITTGAAMLYLSLPAPILIEPYEIVMAAVLLLPASIFGAFIGLPVSALGCLAMARLGYSFAAARSPLAWGLAGALAGGTAAYLLQAEGAWLFGLVATSAACGLLSRRGVSWDER